MSTRLNFVEVTDETLEIYLDLAQSYEGEFSAITKKVPNEVGQFVLDTPIGGNITAYLLYVDGMPAGLAAIKKTGNDHYEICEFYVVPAYRMKSIGKQFAHALWRRFTGEWEVKQIAGAEHATQFWRRVIADFTSNRYAEDIVIDPYWGSVVRQVFSADHSY